MAMLQKNLQFLLSAIIFIYFSPWFIYVNPGRGMNVVQAYVTIIQRPTNVYLHYYLKHFEHYVCVCVRMYGYI